MDITSAHVSLGDPVPLPPVDTERVKHIGVQTDLPELPKADPDDERVKPDGGLVVHSRRSERQRKKQLKRQNRPAPEFRHMFDLPYELLRKILTLLYPSDIIRLSRTNKSLKQFIDQEEATLARNIIRWRYPCLEQCFRLPVSLEDMEPSSRPALLNPDRHRFLKRGFEHVLVPDLKVVCTCFTCLLRWNSLCLAVDFAHFQGHLDRGEPMPEIPRGKKPVWNQKLLKANADVVNKAMAQPLWYACILEAHLKSTVRSIKRHSENQGNRRQRFRMTKEDQQAGTDLFLESKGPPTMDFPYRRDNYYMLEAYLPNRGWDGEKGRWMYMDAFQHDRDVAMIVRRQLEQEVAGTQAS
ncbi:hypothetical protein GE09DRAFT_614676 [Coniochaeta sp. 2T2.1]|nr:hypothetical protein GE09DRAFT_614676 [Coniochaeta sp. 2T2.1]